MIDRALLSLALSLGWVTLLAGQQNARGHEDWYLWTSDGVRHYVTEVGAGDTVIVLHGGPGAEHSYLLDAVEPLADRYRFVLYDQRGSLRSPAPDSTITFGRLVADLDELRAELNLQRITLLGHSNGTGLALGYLAAHPGRVRGLVLTGPVAPVETPGEAAALGVDTAQVRAGRESWQREVEARIAAELAEEGLSGEPRTSRERTFSWRITFTGHNAYFVERWRDMKGGQAFYSARPARALRENEPPGSWEERRHSGLQALAAFAGPIHVILGTFDFTDPGANVWPHVTRRMQNGRLVLLDRAGHIPWLDQPQAFREALEAALARATGSVRAAPSPRGERP